MAVGSIVVLGLFAIVVCGVETVLVENLCDSNCAFEEQIWDVSKFSQVNSIPPGLSGYSFDQVGTDGDSNYYETCVYSAARRLESLGMPIDDLAVLKSIQLSPVCLICKPAFVYLYETQFRLYPSLGLVGDVTYLSGSYQPTTAQWNAFCVSDYDLPDTDNVTYTHEGADVITSHTPACYSIVSCSYTQTAFPLQASRACTPQTFQGYPSNLYCSATYGISPFNIQFKTGCNQGNCNTLKIGLTTNTDFRSLQKPIARRLGRLLATTDPYAIDCLAVDTQFYRR